MRWSLVSALLLAVSLPMPGAEPILYVPVFGDGGQPWVPPGGASSPYETPRGWDATLRVFNPTSTPVTFQFQRLYAAGGSADPTCEMTEHFPIPPGGHDTLYAGKSGFIGEACFSTPTNRPGFVAFRASRGAVVSAFVERFHWVCACPETPWGDCARVLDGRAPLPVFSGLFPGGSEAIAGEIALGSAHPEWSCSDPATARRRVNVTMFNGGASRTEFRVRVLGELGVPDTAPAFEARYLLEAGEVFQVNSLPIPLPTGWSPGRPDAFSWVSVTAGEPFLFYVSTIDDGAGPGAIPVEVHPGRRPVEPDACAPPPVVLGGRLEGGPLGGPGHSLSIDACGCVEEPVTVRVTGMPPFDAACRSDFRPQYPGQTTVTISSLTWSVSETFLVPVDPHIGLTVTARCRDAAGSPATAGAYVR
jgi:hypothetical protein